VGDDLKEEVLRATDIVALVSEYVHLRQAGRNMKALCPFHQEKTPSFVVTPERQSWHCFGRCATGGNAIDFVMRREGLDFRSALRFLADRAGIRIEARASGEVDPRVEALELNRLAARFYRESLLRSREGERARRYLAERGIDEEFSERFELGYAPRGGQWLLNWLGKQGFRPEAVARAGLAGTRRENDERGPGHYDWFRGRLMFPIHDALGRVVGFGGRTFSNEERQKYINTPQTAIFKKGDLLYGLHLAKEAAKARGEVAVVEGYTDVILAHQAGFPFFVATLGTALGREHARALRRLAGRVIVFFDTDAAGLAANDRGLVELATAAFGEGMALFEELRVAVLPEGQDPADAVLAEGPGALARAIAEARSIVDFLLGPLKGASVAERARVLERAARVIAAMPHDAVHYAELQVAALAEKAGVPEATVRDLVMKMRTEEARRARGPAAKERAAPPEPPCPPAERRALACLMAVPALVDEARSAIPPQMLADPRAREIAAALYAGRPVVEVTGEAARRLASEIAASLDPAIDYAREWPDVRARLESAVPALDKECTDDALRALYEKNRRLKSRTARS
jgi:DNA primase